MSWIRCECHLAHGRVNALSNATRQTHLRCSRWGAPRVNSWNWPALKCVPSLCGFSAYPIVSRIAEDRQIHWKRALRCAAFLLYHTHLALRIRSSRLTPDCIVRPKGAKDCTIRVIKLTPDLAKPTQPTCLIGWVGMCSHATLNKAGSFGCCPAASSKADKCCIRRSAVAHHVAVAPLPFAWNPNCVVGGERTHPRMLVSRHLGRISYADAGSWEHIVMLVLASVLVSRSYVYLEYIITLTPVTYGGTGDGGRSPKALFVACSYV